MIKIGISIKSDQNIAAVVVVVVVDVADVVDTVLRNTLHIFYPFGANLEA